MLKHLPGGLVLRSLGENVASDRERLPEFYTTTFYNEYQNDEDWRLAHWTRDLMDGHPTVTPDDIFVVVDPAENDKIVSATLLIPHVWRYEDVEIPFGRPELVATDPAYRARGCVRALFDATHERSAQYGHLLQGITGIPHFYRQFGYTMAVELGMHAALPLAQVKDARPDEPPAYTLRDATDADIPDIQRWDAAFGRTRTLSAVRTFGEWRYELHGRHADSFWRMDYQMIQDAEGRAVGCIMLRRNVLDERTIAICHGWLMDENTAYLAVYEDTLRGLKAWAKTRFGDVPPTLVFDCDVDPSLDTLFDNTPGTVINRREYAWYLRTPNLAAFLTCIAPVLERRMAGSPGTRGWGGTLEVALGDNTGVVMTFERGRLAGVQQVPMRINKGDARFPWLTFLNVVFGYQTCGELRRLFPEAGANRKAALLLEVLFPRQRSWLMAMA